MKKLLFILLAAVALLSVSCKDSKKTDTPDEPVVPDTVFTELNYINGYYVGPLDETVAGSPEYYHFFFSTGNVTMDEEMTPSGTGYIYRFVIFAPSKDENLFPENSIYIGNDSLTANTFYCTTSSVANGYAVKIKITDGEIESELRYTEGLLTILGNVTDCSFLFVLLDENQEEHYLKYTGPANIIQYKEE